MYALTSVHPRITQLPSFNAASESKFSASADVQPEITPVSESSLHQAGREPPPEVLLLAPAAIWQNKLPEPNSWSRRWGGESSWSRRPLVNAVSSACRYGRQLDAYCDALFSSIVVLSCPAAPRIMASSVASSVRLTTEPEAFSMRCPSSAYSAYARGSVPSEASSWLGRAGTEQVTASNTWTCRASHRPTSGASGGMPRMNAYSASYDQTSCICKPKPSTTATAASPSVMLFSSSMTCANDVSGVAITALTLEKSGTWI